MMAAFLRRAVRSWPLVFAVGLLLMVVWVTTHGGTGTEPDTPGPDRPIRAVRSAALQEAREIATRLFMDDFLRELAPAVVADFRAGRVPSMGWPEEMDVGAAGRDTVLSAVDQADLRRLTSRPIAIGLLVVEQGARFRSALGNRAILGTHDGTPYCVMVHTVRDIDGAVAEFGERAIPENRFLSAARRRHLEPEAARDLTHELRRDLLGACTGAHRFGMPGAHIRAWLTGSSTASLGDLVNRSARVSAGRWSRSYDLDVETILNGGYFRTGGYGLIRACRAGDVTECLRLLTPDGDVPEVQEPSILSGWHGALLGRLEREFGPDAFQMFWSSDETVEVAFRNAFETDPADWVRGHAINVDGSLRAGPRPGLVTIGMSLLVILGALAVGTRSALRRSVD